MKSRFLVITIPYSCIKITAIFRNMAFGDEISTAKRYGVTSLDLTIGEI
jgi:hypothetical protein